MVLDTWAGDTLKSVPRKKRRVLLCLHCTIHGASFRAGKALPRLIQGAVARAECATSCDLIIREHPATQQLHRFDVPTQGRGLVVWRSIMHSLTHGFIAPPRRRRDFRSKKVV